MRIRDEKVDIAKGIGILLIVIGHSWIVLHEKGKLFNAIFSFHVPLCFILSGVFVREEDGLQHFTLSKVASVLKPYLVASLFFLGYIQYKILSG